MPSILHATGSLAFTAAAAALAGYAWERFWRGEDHRDLVKRGDRETRDMRARRGW